MAAAIVVAGRETIPIVFVTGRVFGREGMAIFAGFRAGKVDFSTGRRFGAGKIDLIGWLDGAGRRIEELLLLWKAGRNCFVTALPVRPESRAGFDVLKLLDTGLRDDHDEEGWRLDFFEKRCVAGRDRLKLFETLGDFRV